MLPLDDEMKSEGCMVPEIPKVQGPQEDYLHRRVWFLDI